MGRGSAARRRGAAPNPVADGDLARRRGAAPNPVAEGDLARRRGAAPNPVVDGVDGFLPSGVRGGNPVPLAVKEVLVLFGFF
jgi:hypothetical protein